VVHRSLVRHGYDAVVLHGDMSQPARTETLAKFKAGEARLLVCSDVAARGLDIAGLSHVFNFDVPTNAEDYVHRIGRTGRAGRSGRSFTIAAAEDSKYVQAITKLINKNIEVVQIEGLTSAPRLATRPSPATTEAEAPRSPSRRKRPPRRTEEEKATSTTSTTTTTMPPETKEVDLAAEPQPVVVEREERPRERARRPTREDAQIRSQSTPSRRQRGERVYPGEKVPPPVPANAPTKGMGDHVPAFMLRPAR
jgi:superfamily II DNA/RNA helicase